MKLNRVSYIGDDYELLTTLPIKKKDIVMSKVITLYAIELAFSLVILIPNAIVLLIMVKDPVLFLIGLLVAFTIPIVPIAIAMLISLVVTMLTARFKSANLVFIIISTLFIASFSVMGALAGQLGNSQSASMFAGASNFLKWINPSYIFLEMAFNSSYLWILAYVGVNI